MSESGTITATTMSRQPSTNWPLRTFLSLLFLAFLLTGLALSAGTIYNATHVPADHLSETQEPKYWDFLVFYAAAQNLVTDTDRVFDRETMIESISKMYGMEPSEVSERGQGLMRYFNPPFYLLILAPLTLLDVPAAYAITVIVNFAALGVLVVLAGVALRWKPGVTALVGAAMFAFLPVHVALFHAQPNVMIATLIMGAFLAAERGRGVLSACLLALTTAKPQWVALPGLALARQNPKTLAPLVLISGAIALGPFIFLGAGVFLDYVSALSGRTGVDLSEGDFSAHLHNWVGFFRMMTGSPQPEAALLASLLTLATLAVVFKHGEHELTWAAAILTTIVVTPHAHVHEWVVAIPAAVLLLRRPMAPSAFAVTAALLLTIFAWTTTSVIAGAQLGEDGRFIYGHVPAAFALIAWCAALPLVEARLSSSARRIGLNAGQLDEVYT